MSAVQTKLSKIIAFGLYVLGGLRQRNIPTITAGALEEFQL
jgi:hypothetical protein